MRTKTLVVTNSPANLEGRYGTQVDAFERVVRINKGFCENRWPENLGQKTEVWGICGCCVLLDESSLLKGALHPQWGAVKTIVVANHHTSRTVGEERLELLRKTKEVITFEAPQCRQWAADIHCKGVTTAFSLIRHFLAMDGEVTCLGIWPDVVPMHPLYTDKNGKQPHLGQLAREREFLLNQKGIFHLEKE